jgi:DNA-binding LacI/PurR family transcriptional regulator
VTAARVGSVGSDNTLGGRQAAVLLHARDVRHPAFVAGPASSPASTERLTGFREALREAGRREPRVAGSAYSYEGGAAAAAQFWAEGPVDGIFCANDLCALGTIDALRRAGRRVPEDVRVIGYDDIRAAGWGGYDLTSFDQDVPALVEATLTMLARMSEQDAAAGERVLIPPRLTERGSTRARRIPRTYDQLLACCATVRRVCIAMQTRAISHPSRMLRRTMWCLSSS